MEYVPLDRFAERLRAERVRLGMTQEQFGEIGGVRKNSQVSYEKGSTSPTVEYLLAVARVGVDIGYLVTGVRTGEDMGTADRWLVDAFHALSAREREAVIQLVTVLAGRSMDMPVPTAQGAIGGTLHGPGRDYGSI